MQGSISYLNAVWDSGVAARLTEAQWRVLLYLVLRTEHGRWWASMDTLAELSTSNRRSCFELLRTLLESKLAVKDKPTDGRNPAEYRLILPGDFSETPGKAGLSPALAVQNPAQQKSPSAHTSRARTRISDPVRPYTEKRVTGIRDTSSSRPGAASSSSSERAQSPEAAAVGGLLDRLAESESKRTGKIKTINEPWRSRICEGLSLEVVQEILRNTRYDGATDYIAVIIGKCKDELKHHTVTKALAAKTKSDQGHASAAAQKIEAWQKLSRPARLKLLDKARKHHRENTTALKELDQLDQDRSWLDWPTPPKRFGPILD